VKEVGRRLVGKYRGVVSDNRDPEQRGRIRAKVAALNDLEVSWALPCLPYGGNGVGLFLVPPTKANVWIEFEGGDIDYPVWTGCFWDLGQTPVLPALAEKKVLKTDSATITLDDLPGIGGVTIETKTGMKITLSATGVEITNGMNATVKLTGPKVSINDTALEVI
jgi:uncharacterized protein involved in type VI secretion and phage assembly